MWSTRDRNRQSTEEIKKENSTKIREGAAKRKRKRLDRHKLFAQRRSKILLLQSEINLCKLS